MNAVAYGILAFFIGAIPFALLLSRLKNVDLRAHGSGNPGATNAFRVLGPGWGIASLMGDLGKGWLAVALLPGALHTGTVRDGSFVPLAGAAAAVAGHMFSPFARFRGGKGVATTLGAFIALSPLAAIAGVVAFSAVLLLTRFVAAGSLILAIALPVAAVAWGPPQPLRTGVIALGSMLAVAVAWRHRANWKRIASGTESRISWRRPQE
jgi:glycerol-3-phosphate acyltransferase PlsY